MPVDKFGRADVRVISGGATLSLGADKVLKSGDTMTGDLHLSSIGSDSVRQLGCTDLTAGKGFSLVLGNIQNQLQFAIIPNGEHQQSPITLETTHGFMVRTANQDVCLFGSVDNPPIISVYKNIIMNSRQIKNLAEPTDPKDAVTKNYVDALIRKDVLRGVATSITATNHHMMTLSAIGNLHVATVHSNGNIRVLSGSYKILIVGTRPSHTEASYDLFLVVAEQTSKNYAVTTPEFDFTAFVRIANETEVGVAVRRSGSGEQLNMEITLVIERL